MRVQSRAGSCVETINMTRTNELIDQAIEKINKIQITGKNVKTCKDLDEVNTQLSRAKDYLNAIKGIGGLQTHDFSTEIGTAVAVLQDCESLFDKLPNISLESRQINLEHVRYEKQLKPMQDHLDKALQQISSRVLQTPVGLKGGNLVKLSILNDTNGKVVAIFKRNLALMDFLKKEDMINEKDLNGTITLDSAKFEAFKLSISQESSSESASQTPSSETVSGEYTRVDIRGNTIGNKMKFITGHVGAESGYVSSYNGITKFHDNKIGDNGGLIAGDIVGEAAVKTMENFWN